jgi:ribosomal protein L30/L7E
MSALIKSLAQIRLEINKIVELLKLNFAAKSYME